jgi:2-phospho-L-lactate/phosphoenolpyruvate guanylyltransferase
VSGWSIVHDVEPGWSVVLPIKGGAAAKSRLRSGWEQDDTLAPTAALTGLLAEAIAADTLAAAVACPAVHTVLVVTADPQVTAWLPRDGVVAVPESNPGSGLAGAIEDGLRAAPAGPVAILLGDVPALRPQDLDAALWTAALILAERRVGLHGGAMAAVPDADGTGTVLLASLQAADLAPAFGTASFGEHRRRGAVAIGWELGRLRRDVDTPTDLWDAAALGLGPRTAAVLGLQHGSTLTGCSPDAPAHHDVPDTVG